LFTKQPWAEIRAVEKLELDGLHVFDIPVLAGIVLVVVYLGLCSFMLSQWDPRWNLLQAFYFFFISLRLIIARVIIYRPLQYNWRRR
jgi:hypothetical protein